MSATFGKRWLGVVAMILVATIASTPNWAFAQAAAAEPASDGGGPSNAFLIRVPLPLRGTADHQVKRQIDQAVGAFTSETSRPLVVLEFASDGNQSGQGSEYERALSLARYLAGGQLSHVRTVAFIPNRLNGHAVLAALACEEIVMGENAQIGEAGIDETKIDVALRASYEDIANRRRIFPTSVVMGMLDPSEEVYKAETLDGAQYVNKTGLSELQARETVSDVNTIVRQGVMASFGGVELRNDYRFVSRLANNRQELAIALRAPNGRFSESIASQSQWVAVRVDLHGVISSRIVREAIQTIDAQVRDGSANLLCIHINSSGGSPANSAQLANYLASFDPTEMRTVAFIEKKARGDASLPAMACDELYMTEGAVLGGPGESHLSDRARFDLKAPLQEIARRKAREWSLMFGLMDGENEVFRYTREGGGQVKFMTNEEWESLESREQWQRGELLNLAKGVSASQAIDWGIAKQSISGFDELKRIYSVEDFREAKRSSIVSTIEKVASQRWLARTLLFVAFLALISEASAPGLGVPGFISATCFMLFFWMQFLNGTAGWLEVVLFVGGIGFLIMEFLVIPGFGVFGVGGIVMVFGSIFLATQTFVVPRNTYQYDQLSASLFTLIAGVSGTIAGLLVLRHVLPRTPWAKRMLLLPPKGAELEERERRESLADYDFLAGKQGVAHTPLRPTGKAMIGDELVDVISQGDIIDRGAVLRVVEVRGHHIVVEAVEPAA